MSKIRMSTTKDQTDDQSIGILNMDELKVFGEYSRGSNTSGNSRISGRLNLERSKALETLEKSQKTNFFRKPQDVANKENSNTLNKSPKLNHTDYVPYRKPNTINITDLITDETINLETSSSLPSATKDTKVSFEPAEITARSTHYKKENVQNRKQRDSIKASARLSVSDILASSFAPKARNLCEVLPPPDRSSCGGQNAQVGHLSSAVSSSSFNSYDSSRSLPRTADMSLSKNSHSEMSFGAAINTNGFSSFVGVNNDAETSAFDDFTPGEFMQSKLLNDEISWAQQYAAIPAAALSEQAKAKARSSSIMTSTHFDSPTESNSMIAADPNFSVGDFFNMRSEKIWNIVQKKSPEKCRTPIALVDEHTVTTSSTNSAVDSASDISLTPKIDNKTYSKVAFSSNNKNEKHESKDSGNSSDTSYLLSMSAIDRALCNLDIQTDASEVGVINQIKLQAKKQKTNKNHYRDPCDKDAEVALCATTAKQSITSELEQQVEELLMENKENVDPNTLGKSGDLSDTLSFTESLLNSSAMKTLDQSTSISQARSPLSPIENIPIIQINEEENNDADIDEWPSTPIKLPHRVIRRSKSPKDGSARSDYISISPEIGNSLNSRSELPTKSLCSTRLDGEKNISNKCDFSASPKLSKSNTLVANGSGNISPTLCSSRSGSPASYEHSPLSSPRSCLSSQASSPSGGYRSPNLDSTTNSDRRFLNVAGAVRRTNSSPVYNELAKCSNFPVRNNSRTSMKSSSSAAGRSSSRCSNSSEFSHRDGKLIPVKVTCLELSWSSSRLRTDVRKSMQVKNISNKRLVLRVEVHGPGFQIVNSQGNILTLQPQECRTIIINFCATVTGTAVGSLAFYSPQGTTSSNKPFLEIPLNAYGGHATILPRYILRGPVGSAFLPMGDLRELQRPLEQTFKLYNKGPLLGFASVSISSSGLRFPRLFDAFEIMPDRMLIAPGSAVTVRIVFRPKREDIKNIYKKISNVLSLANMRVICGDEANRQRIRQLVARMSAEERSKIASSYLEKLWSEFKDEVEMSELEAFKEEPNVAMDLLCNFRIHEISLTLNHDSLDETTVNSSIACPDADETVLFRTVCVASPTPQQMLEPVDELLEGTLVADDERAVSSTREGSWSVRPNTIEFDFMAKRRQSRVSLLIKNSYKSRQYFEVVCNFKDLLRFTPSEGYVQPDDGQIEVEVNTIHERAPTDIRSREVVIMVYLENERITVPVKIPDDNFS